MERHVATIAILGPGGIGGLLAGLLTRQDHEVICITKESSAPALSRSGITVHSIHFGRFSCHPKVTTRLDASADFLFITVKSPNLSSALDRVSGTSGVIIPLLNGLEHVPIIRSRFNEADVLVATIGKVEAFVSGPGRVEHPSPYPPEVTLADARASDDVASLLEGAGLSVAREQSEAQTLWVKLVRLSAIAATTAAANLPLGAIRDHSEWRSRLRVYVNEACVVAQAEGARVVADEVMTQIETLPYELETSLQRDIRQKRESELDAIVGAVLRAGARYGIKCPTIESLAMQLGASL